MANPIKVRVGNTVYTVYTPGYKTGDEGDNHIVNAPYIDIIVVKKDGVEISRLEFFVLPYAQTIFGLGGNDTIVNNAYQAYISGGDGDDSIANYSSYMNSLFSGDWVPYTIDGGKSTIFGDAGNDYIYNEDKLITIDGGTGNDHIHNTGNSVSISGGSGDNTIFTGGSNVIISAGSGNDFIVNSEETSNVSINAGEGNNNFDIQGTKTTVIAGSGDDFVGVGNSSVSVNVGAGNNTIHVDSVSSDVTINAGSGNDVVWNKPGSTKLKINLGEGKNTLNTAATNSSILTGSGDDSIWNMGDKSTLNMGAGNNFINNGGNDVSIVSGTDSDTVFNGTGSNVTINVGAGNDRVTNTGGSVTIDGGAGNDSIWNGGENVSINAGNGNNYINNNDQGDYTAITGGTGDDSVENGGTGATINVGDGANYVKNIDCAESTKIVSGSGNDSIDNCAGKVTVVSGAGKDFIANYGGNSVSVDTGADADTINNLNGHNSTLFGGAGNDSILNNHGNNLLIRGDAGDDFLNNYGGNNVTIDGGADNDTLLNGSENVSISGGAGNDGIMNQGGQNVTINAGTGNDTINNTGSSNVLIQYKTGDGNDLIQGFNDTTTLQINGSYSTTKSGSNIIFTVGTGKITLEGAASLGGFNVVNAQGTILQRSAIKGTEDADTLNNTFDKVSILAYGGNDVIRNGDWNTSLGSSVSIDAGAGDDSIDNYSGSNVTINAGIGNDSISNNGSSVKIDAGNGINTINNGGSNVSIDAGNDNDSISNDGSSVKIDAGDGINTVWNGGSNVSINSGNGNDSINNNGSSVNVDTGAGNDSIVSETYGKNLKVSSGDGNDYIINNGSNGVLDGGTGNDTINNWGSDTSINGGDDNDSIMVANSKVTVEGGNGDDHIETYYTWGDDGGNYHSNFIKGGAGKDTIGNRSFNTTIDAGADDDVVYNWQGNNVSINAGEGNNTVDNNQGSNVTITAGAGNDSIRSFGEVSNVLIDAGNGNNEVGNNVSNSTLKTGTGDDYISSGGDHSSISAGAGNDTITNSGSDVSIDAGAGSDSIETGGSNVTVSGGAGNDYIKGWSDGLVYVYTGGNDTIEGFRSYDTLVLGKLKISSSVRGDNEDLTLKFSNNGTLLLKGGYGAYTLQTVASASDVKQINVIDVQSDKSFTGTSGRDIVHGIGNWDNQANTFTGFSNVTINTGDGGDFIETGGKNIKVYAGAGNDTLNNFGSNVTISGDADDDCLNNLGNNVSISGGVGNDTIDNNGTDSTLLGGEGNDTVFNAGRAVRNLIDLGDGNDSLQQDAPNSTVIGGNGDDFIHNDGDNSSVISGDGHDTILNHADNATVESGIGNDIIQNGGNKVLINMSDGNDSIENTLGDSVTIDAGTGDDVINSHGVYFAGGKNNSGYRLGNKISINGGAGNDSIFIESEDVTIDAGTGNDTIFIDSDYSDDWGGKTYADYESKLLIQYKMGDGNDLIEGFHANSTLSITGGSYSTLESGSDIIVTVGDGKITLKGAATVSTVHINDEAIVPEKQFHVDGTEKADSINNTLSGVTINALGGKDTIYNNAVNVTIYAGADNDSIGNHGGYRNANDLIDAGDGADTIDNHANDLTLKGGAGNDSIYNGSWNVSVDGGDGNDTIISENPSDNVTLNGGKDNDYIRHDNSSGDNISITSGDGADTVWNISKNVTINTGAGNDSIANDSNASIDCGDGDDYIENNDNVERNYNTRVTIKGGKGNDTIRNNATGSNVLIQYTSGDGNDTVYGFNAKSTLNITGGNYLKSKSGKDVIITVGNGKVTLKDAASLSAINIDGIKGLPTGTFVDGNTVKVSTAFTGNKIELEEFDDATAVDASAFTKALTIVGTELDNTIRGGTGNDTLTGGNGADTFVISGGKDIITDYTAANDKISVDGAANVSIDKYGDTSITVGKNSFVLKKLADENPLTNGKQITFTDGNGTTTKTYFNDRIILGDKVTLTSAFKGTFDAANFTAVDASSVKSSISIIGNAGANTLVSGTGNDTINGGAGQNFLTGGTGKDIFIYGGGNDTITDYDPADKISLGSAQVQGFSVTDKDVTFNLGDNKSLTLKDAAGKKVTFADGKQSTVDIYTAGGVWNSAGTAITLNAAIKTFTADSNLVTIDGSNTSELVITGNDKANLILDGAGNDTLTGGKGNDIFIYGGGNDTITDYDPADKISLGSAQVQGFSVTDKDVTFNLSDNKSLTLKDAAGKKVTFADGKKSTVNIYTADGIMNPVETAITLNADMKTFTAGEKLATIDASNTSGVVVTGNVKANMFIGGNGSDTFVYTTGAGNDTIDNYGAGDKISVSGATITEASVNKNGHTSLKVGRNAITVKNSSEVTIVDDGGEKIFSNGIFYNKAKTVTTLPVNFSAKGTTLFDAQTIDASLVSKAVNISGNDAANSILGSAKNDTLNGGTGNNTLTGGKGNDIFVYGGGNDTITDYDPADKISLGSAQVQSFSATDKDVTFNLGDNKSLTLKDAAGKKVTFADGKKSTVNVYTTDGVWNSAETAITLNAAIKTFEADSKLVTINGSNTSGVVITGNVKGNMLFGGSGSDTFVYEMGAGNDTIDNYGASDKFSLVSATITDASINKNGSAVLKVGKNSVTVKNSSEVTIVDEGGEKVFSNGIFYNTGKTVATLPVSFSAKGTAQFEVQTIDASLVSKAVNISGNDAANSILGSAKNDTLNGGTGNNTLTGDKGVDIFIYGGGNDTITDYDPADKISLGSAQVQGFSVKDKDVTFNLSGSKTLTLKDAAGKKVTFADGKKSTVNIYTTDGVWNSAGTAITLNAAIKTFTADSNLVTIDGSNTSELVITGNDKANVFTGGKGNDSLLGNTGNDKLYGNAGNDTLVGGAGNDSLWGQAGADTFLYANGDGKDIIFGFDDDDMLQITGEFTASYSTNAKAVAFKVGTTASAITLKDFTATTFNVNGNDYTITDNKFVKK